MLRRGLLVLVLALLAHAATFAQAVGDYRSSNTNNQLDFMSTAGWDVYTATGWRANGSAALDITKTFTIRHTKVFSSNSTNSTFAKIIVKKETGSLIGKLTVSGKLLCTDMVVDGTGAMLTVDATTASFSKTTAQNGGIIYLNKSSLLGNVTLSSLAVLRVTGTNNAIVLGPVTASDDAELSIEGPGALVSGVNIMDGGILTIKAATTLKGVQVQQGGLIQRTSSAELLIDETVGVTDMQLNGQWIDAPSATDIKFSTGATMAVGATGTYEYANNGGKLPLATWDPASTLEIVGVKDAATFTGNDNQTFGNIIWNTPSSTTPIFRLSPSGNMKIAGKLSVRSTGSGELELLAPTGAQKKTMTIGSYEQTAGVVNVSRTGTSTALQTVNVAGNFSVTGSFRISNSTSTGPNSVIVGGTTRINNNSKLVVSGGVPSSAAATGELHLQGDLIMDSGSKLEETASAANGSTVATVVFDGGKQQNYINTSGNATTVGRVNVTVAAGTTLNMANYELLSDATTVNGGIFTVSAKATLMIGHAAGIARFNANNAAASAKGNIQLKAARTYAAGATYIYTGTAGEQVTGNGLPATLNTNGKLVVDNPSGNVTLSQALTINGVLSLKQGYLKTNGQVLTLGLQGSWQDASDNSYVEGSMQRVVDNPATVYTFPIGNTDGLQLAGVRPQSAEVATFEMNTYRFSAPSPMSFAAGSGLMKVSMQQYWNVRRASGTGDAFVRLYYTLPYSDVSEAPDAQKDLRVAGFDGSFWQSYGQEGLPNTLERYLTSGSALAITDAFKPVTFGSGSVRNPLPIELISFKAKLLPNQNVQLTWQTAQERDCKQFEVQVSTDGRTFKGIGTYQARGAATSISSYEHLDKTAFLGSETTRYYRLEQIDNDGSLYHFPVITVNGGGRNVRLTAWPVPATDQLTVSFRAAQPRTAIRILDAAGRVCAEQIATSETNRTITVPMSVASLRNGLYLVQINSVSGIEQFRFIKE